MYLKVQKSTDVSSEQIKHSLIDFIHGESENIIFIFFYLYCRDH